MDEPVRNFQDLGESTVTIRKWDEVGANGVARLIPDDDGSHLDALADIRETIDKHYGERIEDLADDGQEVIIERVVLRSDDLPHIEYRVATEK